MSANNRQNTTRATPRKEAKRTNLVLLPEVSPIWLGIPLLHSQRLLTKSSIGSIIAKLCTQRRLLSFPSSIRLSCGFNSSYLFRRVIKRLFRSQSSAYLSSG